MVDPQKVLETMHVCRECVIPHIDNCPHCLGFGLKRSQLPLTPYVPITAEEAHTKTYPAQEWERCAICGSTPAGLNEIDTDLGVMVGRWQICGIIAASYPYSIEDVYYVYELLRQAKGKVGIKTFTHMKEVGGLLDYATNQGISPQRAVKQLYAAMGAG